MSKWSYSAGEKGNTVTVYERTKGGPLYVRAYDPTLREGKGGYRRKSLEHRDREKAKSYADKQAAKLREGTAEVQQGPLTLARLFAHYERHRLPRKSEHTQKVNKRQMQAWKRFLGAGKDPAKISLGEWEAYIDARSAGAIDSRGRHVPEKDRTEVRARTVEKDMAFLRHVLRWATRWRDGNGSYLMRENPVRGFDIPREKNPMRPVATADRYEAIRKVTDRVMMEVSWNGKTETVRSHLSEIFQVVNGTGRRISAVCALRHEDLRLERTERRPFGAIRWPAQTDKMGHETEVPIRRDVREAIDRARQRNPGIGDTPLFPSPTDPQTPVAKDLADKWLQEAETEAGVEPQKGGLWHPYRRKWVTERKHLPDRDVAEAGGWKSLEALRQCYQQADEETMLEVVLATAELREVR